MIELAYTEYGNAGRPVIVMHGLFGSARNWTAIAKTLGETHRVLALDLRNHGASPHAATMTYGEMAEDVAGFIAAHGLEKPAVIGHSMGGKVAMRLALDAPETPRGILVADIAPVDYDHDMLDYIAAMKELDLSGAQRRAELQEQLAAQVDDTGITAFLMTNLERADDGFRWRVNLDAIETGMRDLTAFPAPEGAAYEGPALFVTGDRSDYVQAADRPRIAELFPAARTMTIKNAAHWLHADQPQAFLKTAQAFLKAVD